MKFLSNPYGHLDQSPTLIEFFQTWCMPCHGTVGKIAELAKRIKVISVSDEAEHLVNVFYAAHPSMGGYAVAVDTDKILTPFIRSQRVGFPTVFLLYQNKIVHRGSPSEPSTDAAITALVDGFDFLPRQMLENAIYTGREMDFCLPLLVMTFQSQNKQCEEMLGILFMLSQRFENKANFVLLTGERETWATNSVVNIQREVIKIPNQSASDTKQHTAALHDESQALDNGLKLFDNCPLILAFVHTGSVARLMAENNVLHFYIFDLEGELSWDGAEISGEILQTELFGLE